MRRFAGQAAWKRQSIRRDRRPRVVASLESIWSRDGICSLRAPAVSFNERSSFQRTVIGTSLLSLSAAEVSMRGSKDRIQRRYICDSGGVDWRTAVWVNGALAPGFG